MTPFERRLLGFAGELVDLLNQFPPAEESPEVWDGFMVRIQRLQEDRLYPTLKSQLPEEIKRFEEDAIPKFEQRTQAAHERVERR